MPKGYKPVPNTNSKSDFKPGFWQKKASEATIATDFIELLGYLKEVFGAIVQAAPQAGWIQIPYKTITMLLLPIANAGITLKNLDEKKNNATRKDALAMSLSLLSGLSSLCYYIFWMASTYGNFENKAEQEGLTKALPYFLMASLLLNSTKRYVEKMHDDEILEARIADLENQRAETHVPKQI